MKKGILIIFIAFAGLMTSAYTSRHGRVRDKSPKPTTEQTLDSLHWLIERHCDNRTEKMGRNDGTLDLIVRKFKTLPTAVADSLLNAQYDYMVVLFEQERNKRAYAIADCYYALAKKDDPNLGALYLNDIVLAIENNDTLTLRRRIDELRVYAIRNDMDYDQDLAEAERNMDLVKRRIRFNEMPTSAFVDKADGGVFWMLHMRDIDYNQIKWILHLDRLIEVHSIGLGEIREYSLKADKYHASLSKDWNKYMLTYTPSREQLDETRKTFFVALGTERGGNPNPQLIASSRQTIQNLHAQVSGELARKKYSYGKRAGGELLTAAIDAGLNALLDRWSVTTQTAIRKEITLTLTKPELLEGYMNIVRVSSRSDRPQDAKTETAVLPIRYYKMHPEDGLYYIDEKNRPIWAITMYGWSDEYEKVKASAKAWKRKLNDWKKANKGKTPAFTEYHHFRNDSVSQVLMQRAENSLENLEL